MHMNFYYSFKSFPDTLSITHEYWFIALQVNEKYSEENQHILWDFFNQAF